MLEQLLGQTGLASLLLFVLLALLFLIIWFFVNRASVKATRQIQLLHDIAEQQRRQTELLEILVRSQGKSPADAFDDDHVSSLRGFIPER
ncbi:YebO family protein [Rouxiella chamberiensis]|uniref:YebO family protein n=1 Tax=Rouxiella chamberiensis TaxID=1513468 RepID=A0ABY7HTU8_9GAMM|nr:YebO family protein [Rouxiella chamberiensis]WAT02853.1 YebO family protein [Rouxiella chamberiensis]